MGRDSEYISMKTMLERSRRGFVNEDVQQNPHVINNQDSKLSDQVLTDDSSDQKISLDNNLEASVVSKTGEVAGNVIVGLQTVLNGLVEAIQGMYHNIDRIVVTMDESVMTITMNIVLVDSNPLIFIVNSEKSSVQIQYEGYLELTNETIGLFTRMKNYFNPKLMANLQAQVAPAM